MSSSDSFFKVNGKFYIIVADKITTHKANITNLISEYGSNMFKVLVNTHRLAL